MMHHLKNSRKLWILWLKIAIDYFYNQGQRKVFLNQNFPDGKWFFLRRRRWSRDFENILYPLHYWDFLLPCIVLLTVMIFLNQLFSLSSIQQYINLRGGSPTLLPLIIPN